MTPSLRRGVWGSFTTPRTRGLGDPSALTRAAPLVLLWSAVQGAPWLPGAILALLDDHRVAKFASASDGNTGKFSQQTNRNEPDQMLVPGQF